jgi:class 3 adenylate cyclase
VEFINEAVLVVDLAGSTHLATHYGNGLAMHARNILKERILEAAKAHGLAFAENTGDGYFMTFPSVVGAVQTAIALLTDLRERPPDLSSGPPLGVRAGISYGEILLDSQGARHGAAINKAFRLEGLSRDSFAQVESKGEIADRNRVFLDEEAAQELRDAEIPLQSVGLCSLKGFSGLHRVFEVFWDRRE